METNTLIEDVRNRLLGYIEKGDLSLNWKSDAFETTIAKISDEEQNLLRNQLQSFQLCVFKKPSLQTLQRGDYCAIRLPNNDLYLARTGYWQIGHLQTDLCNHLPVWESDNGLPLMYPDGVVRQLCRNHGIPIPESIYVGVNPYIQACRACGRRLRTKDNFGWEPIP